MHFFIYFISSRIARLALIRYSKLYQPPTLPIKATKDKGKPRYIVDSLEEFLIPGAVEKLTQQMDAVKFECVSLFAKARAPKRKAKKGDTEEETAAKFSQAQANARQAKEDLAQLSKKLVGNLVKTIEEQNMLKQALTLRRTSASNSGLPDVATSWLIHVFVFFQ